MKQLTFLIVAFLCLSLSFAQDNEEAIAVEDYQRATEFLRSNTNKLVDNTFAGTVAIRLLYKTKDEIRPTEAGLTGKNMIIVFYGMNK